MNTHVPYSCDIVLPVYNGLTYVRNCIESLLTHTPSTLYRLHIIDDASDGATWAYLQQMTAAYNHFSLHRNTENLGFLKSCNKGMALGEAPFVLLLNSDVIVTPGWLETLTSCAEQDKKIAAVNPLSNHAANLSLPIATGLNFLDMHDYLSHHAPREAADVVTNVGFCLLLRRIALAEVGLFDEIYDRGYCEESDLCMRLTTSGWRTVVAMNCYVYHKGSGSFSDRDARYAKNRAIFDSRWKTEYLRQFALFRKANPLDMARILFEAESRWSPIPSLRITYRALRRSFAQKSWRPFFITFLRGLRSAIRARRTLVSDDYFTRFRSTSKTALSVTYVLPTLSLAGGVLSVIQLVNELTLAGVEARIATLSIDLDVKDWPLFTAPILYGSSRELLDNFPQSDIAVATHWTTARHIAEVLNRGKASHSVYFLQDYESWFYPDSKMKMRKRVLATYKQISHKIVKSDWLAHMLGRIGYATVKIPLGMNLDIFYPRRVAKSKHPVVMAMARSSTPWRGYTDAVESLRLVKQQYPHVEIVLFGDAVPADTLPFAATITGSITNQNALAELYSYADIFLDASTFQGFGRPALEAMACGTACVLTNVGGVNEYARHEQNCLLAAPHNPETLAASISRLIEDLSLRQHLVHAGLATAKDYCHRREARDTLQYFKRLMEQTNGQ